MSRPRGIPLLQVGEEVKAFHEIGHYLAEQMGFDWFGLGPKAGELSRIEAMADGFAVAWAVAKGADPQACARDVGVFRACHAVNGFAAAYQTYGVLEPAAEIGLAMRRDPHPWRMMDRVNWACARHLPPKDLLDELQGKSWEEVEGHPHAARLARDVKRFASMQPSWRRADETTWWARLVAANPEEAPALQRLPATVFLSRMSRLLGDSLEGAPCNARTVLKMLRMAAAAEGPQRARSLAAMVPEERSRAAFAEAYRKAERLFDGELDLRIREMLGRMADHAERCAKEPEQPAPSFRGGDAPVRPFVLVDVRSGSGITHDAIEDLSERLSGQEVRAIAVVGETEQGARAMGEWIRRDADMMRASLHPMTPERFEAKRADILAARRAGRLMAVGGLPELDRAGTAR